MIEHRDGDIFEQTDLDYIIHQCNLFHTFGSGIASTIAKKFPYAAEYDRACGKTGDRSRLGTFLVADDPKMMRISIVNSYSQDGLRATNRTTNYSALGKVLFDLEQYLRSREMPGDRSTILGIPHKIGCGLAGGDWGVVLPMIESAFSKSRIKTVICFLSESPKNNRLTSS